MLQQIPVPAVIIDTDNKIVETNSLFDQLNVDRKDVENFLSTGMLEVYGRKSSYKIEIGERQADGSAIMLIVEKDFAEQSQAMAALLQSLEDIILEVDSQLRFKNAWTNDESRLFAPKKNILGKKISDIIPPPLSIQLSDVCQRILFGSSVETVTYGSPIPNDNREFEARMTPVYTGNEVSSVAVLIRETTELNLKKRQLREALGRLELITGLPDSPVIYTAQADTISNRFTSQNVVHLCGYDLVDGELEKSWGELIVPEDIAQVDTSIQEFLSSNDQSVQLNYRIHHKDGRTVWIRESMVKDLNRKQEITAIHGTLMDITSLQSALMNLQANQDLLNRAGHVAKLGAWEFNPKSGKYFWSSELYQILEIDPDSEIKAESGLDYYHPDDRNKAEEAFVALVEKGEKYDIDVRLHYEHGRTKWVRSIGLPVLRGDEVIFCYGMIQDITEMKDRERELHESMSLFNQAFMNAPLGITLIGMDGLWLKVNPALCSLTGYTEEELVGRHFMDLVHPDDIPDDKVAFNQIIEGKAETIEREKRYIKKNGDIFWVKMNASVVRDKSGNPRYFITQVFDVTDRRNYELQILKTSEEARKAAKAKSEFLAQMSHEIRTPMNAVVGITNLLYEETRNQPEMHEKIEVLKFGADNLLSIVNDILDVSKIEQGSLKIDMLNVDIREILKGVKGIYAQRADEKQLDFNVHIGEDVPMLLKGDPQRITQILNNLVSNAIKYTNKGKVDVYVEGERNKENFDLSVRVVDTGIGLDQDIQKILFEPFTQSNSSAVKNIGGTGLGLSISKRLAELMDGKLTFHSVLNQGSEFVLNLTMKVVRKDKTKTTSSTSYGQLGLKGVRLLLVEDNTMNVYVATRFLRNWGCTVEVSMSGEQAIARSDLSEIDIILMDMQMPGMNGIETVEKLREADVEAPVFMLTAATDLKEKENEWQHLKIEDVIFKPIVADDLYHKLYHVISSKSVK
ncbi:PAS domain-containing hybrid sensor histidine kinase/response regulator [Phaeocystidibacter marisrubri]|uniref:histidine kinase n=1 Tax=Phaeocystidibacter marisrubri TaxID=1577780 RepID=A0A6L3ZIY4_9FLAO|nr:PAS domain-containing hybrid sensor histidine kinase/response regulator [Phaeocystidibacter marisrubri]KAB2817787.1 PAS domain S-box protein [Phaeocystidibacter marisrubri]GGH73539.1 hypothetical protein GCM10011318_18660 [Phaeocystidibacter marisrubri]